MPSLKQELLNLQADINHQIATIIRDANDHDPAIPAMQIRDMNGNYMLVPLLLAKAQVLSALANLKG